MQICIPHHYANTFPSETAGTLPASAILCPVLKQCLKPYQKRRGKKEKPSGFFFLEKISTAALSSFRKKKFLNMREANGTENLFQTFGSGFFCLRRSEKRRRWRVDTPTRQQHGEQTKLSVSGWSLINHSVPGADLWQGKGTC